MTTNLSERVLLELAVRSGQVDSKQIAAHEGASELSTTPGEIVFNRIVHELTNP